MHASPSTLSGIPLISAKCLKIKKKKGKKKQNQLIYNDLVILLVIFWIFNRFTDVLADELQAYHWCLRVFLGVVLSSHCCGTVGAAGAAILKQGAFVPLSALSFSGQPLC